MDSDDFFFVGLWAALLIVVTTVVVLACTSVPKGAGRIQVPCGTAEIHAVGGQDRVMCENDQGIWTGQIQLQPRQPVRFAPAGG